MMSTTSGRWLETGRKLGLPSRCGKTPVMGNDTSPAVMLSPNARNFVTVSCGVLATVTVNEHVPVRFSESVAVHATVVAPSGNVAPEAGVHVTVTGSLPALTVGAANVTVVPEVEMVLAVTDAGQVSVGGSGSGVGTGGIGTGTGVGVVAVLLPQAPVSDKANTATSSAGQNPVVTRQPKNPHGENS